MSWKTELKAFGIGQLDLPRVLARALRNGGALAEVFFEETASSRVMIDGGRVDQVVDGTDRGAGLRILFDHRSVYGYTTDLTQNSLETLAETLSAAVSLPAGQSFKPWKVRQELVKRLKQAPAA